MKKILLIFSLFLFYNCASQNRNKIDKIDLSSNDELNYIFSRIYTEDIEFKELFNRSLFVTIYKISDSKITPEDYSEADQFLTTLFISINPDGDSYFWSKLFKIEGLANPKIISIKENEYPNFTIVIETGKSKKTKSNYKFMMK